MHVQLCDFWEDSFGESFVKQDFHIVGGWEGVRRILKFTIFFVKLE